MTADPRLIRLDETRLKIVNDARVDATLFANTQVPIESSAVDELIGVTELRQTTERLAEHDPKFFQSFEQPDNGIFLLPDGERHRDALELFWDAMSNAANFAFANRLFLGLMAFRALQEVCGDVSGSLVYDAPHNLVWKDQFEGEEIFLHCDARG